MQEDCGGADAGGRSFDDSKGEREQGSELTNWRAARAFLPMRSERSAARGSGRSQRRIILTPISCVI